MCGSAECHSDLKPSTPSLTGSALSWRALLDMSRLHTGTLAVHLEPVGLEPVGLDEMVSRRSSLPSPPLHRGRLGCEEATSPP